MSGKKQTSTNREKRKRYNSRHKREDKKGGKTRAFKKMSPTARFRSLNRDFFPNLTSDGKKNTNPKMDWRRIKDVPGFGLEHFGK